MQREHPSSISHPTPLTHRSIASARQCRSDCASASVLRRLRAEVPTRTVSGSGPA